MVLLREALTTDSIDQAITAAIGEGIFPGAAVQIQKGDAILKRAAYGHGVLYANERIRLDSPVPATVETRFDLASLTKVVTTVGLLQLAERGAVLLDEPVAAYLPDFGRREKRFITVRQLLTHTSGLPAGRPFYRHLHNAHAIVRAVAHVRPAGRPGEHVLYSDLNFIAAGALVSSVAGMPLDRYLTTHLFEPLGMRRTGYRPRPEHRPQIAATEHQPGRGLVWGSVHDENAAAMDGVSGHAGLFSTADDLAVFCAMLLNQGRHAELRILQPITIHAMFSLQTGALAPARSLGWVCNDPSWMGTMASPHAFGHTGFTGASIVLDLQRRLSVILLTNRVHPHRAGPSLAPIRAAVATAAAAWEGKD